VDERPIDRQATLALARGARRLHVRLGDTLARLEGPFTDADLAKYLVHEDGFLRVPVLVVDDLIVRGYTEALYQDALGA